MTEKEAIEIIKYASAFNRENNRNRGRVSGGGRETEGKEA